MEHLRNFAEIVQYSSPNFVDYATGLDRSWVKASLVRVVEYGYAGEYMAIFDDTRDHVCEDCSNVCMYFHPGGFTSGDMYDTRPHMRSLCQMLDAPILSVRYPLVATSFASYHPVRAATDRALAYVSRTFPGARIWLTGASAGGTIAIDLAVRWPGNVTAVYVDSPILCVDTLQQDFFEEPHKCYQAVGEDSPRWPLKQFEHQGLCFRQPPTVPTFLSMPTSPDPFMPAANYRLWMDGSEAAVQTNRSFTLCRDALGVHSYSISISGGCAAQLHRWASNVLALRWSLLRWLTSVAFHETARFGQFALERMAFALDSEGRIFCKHFCDRLNDEYMRKVLRCHPDHAVRQESLY